MKRVTLILVLMAIGLMALLSQKPSAPIIRFGSTPTGRQPIPFLLDAQQSEWDFQSNQQ
jgi:hypothetical protein